MADVVKAVPPRTGARKLSPEFLARRWKPGQSGNPSGNAGGDYVEMMRICRQFTPDAAYTIAALMFGSEDDRVRLMASKELMERAWGKPREAAPEGSDPSALERRTQLIAAMVQLLSGQTPKP